MAAKKKPDLAAMWERCRPKSERPYTSEEALFDACVLHASGHLLELKALGERWNQSDHFVGDVVRDIGVIVMCSGFQQQPVLIEGDPAKSRATTAPDRFDLDAWSEVAAWMDAHADARVRELLPKSSEIIEQALEYHRSKGTKFINWPAAMRNWILKEAKRSRGSVPDPAQPALRVPASQGSRDLADLFGAMLKRRWPLAVEVGTREAWSDAIEALPASPSERENLIRWYCHKARDDYEFLPVITSPLQFADKWNKVVTSSGRREPLGDGSTVDSSYWNLQED